MLGRNHLRKKGKKRVKLKIGLVKLFLGDDVKLLEVENMASKKPVMNFMGRQMGESMLRD